MALSRRRLLGLAGLGVVSLATGTGCRASDAVTGPGGAPATRPPTTVADVEAHIDRFLVNPDLNGAALLAIAMGEEGSDRWVPHLVDLLRLAGDDEGGQQIRVALQRITDEYVLDDVQIAFITYGGWMLQHRPDPGPGYDRWKQTLYGAIDPRFATMLAQVADRFVLTELQWGGVGPDGIPPLQRPARTPAAEAAWAVPDELVFAFTVAGAAVAYPERILGYHELANDVIGGTDVVVTYCPLCRAARAQRAGGHRFTTSGLLRNSNKVMVDEATGSLWQQVDGTAFAGPLAGTRLEPLDLRTSTWAEWVAAHPDGEVVAIPEPGSFPTTRYRYEPGEAYRRYDEGAELWFPVLSPPPDIPATATVAGLTGTGWSFAVDTDALGRQGRTEIDTPGGRVLAVPDPTGALLYPLDADGRPAADALRTERATWFSWYGTHPDTGWWPRG